MERTDLIYKVLVRFVSKYYGEDVDEACYDLDLLAIEINHALTEQEKKKNGK